MTTAYGLEIPTSFPEICRPERMAILIYDMQVGIVSQITTGNRIVKGCETLLAAAHAAGYRCSTPATYLCRIQAPALVSFAGRRFGNEKKIHSKQNRHFFLHRKGRKSLRHSDPLRMMLL
jgi:hypothetical protein